MMSSPHSQHLNSQLLVDRIKSGENQALEELYTSHRRPFFSWAFKQFKCSEREAKELYQIIILILYDNVMQGKLIDLRCSVKSYLFAIAKNKWREWQRKKMFSFDQLFFSTQLPEEEVNGYSEEFIHDLTICMDQLGRPGRDILESYYYKKKSMIEIAEELGYKNASTAKNLKYKSLQRLKKLMKKRTEHKNSFSGKVRSGV